MREERVKIGKNTRARYTVKRVTNRERFKNGIKGTEIADRRTVL